MAFINPVSTKVPATVTAPMAPPSDTADFQAQMRAQSAETMAFTLMQGKINKEQGMATAVANMGEAFGQAAKNRGEAAKQMV